MADDLQQRILAEARSWLGTPHGHQQTLRGVAVDCDNFVAQVAHNAGVKLSEEWINNYRRIEDGRKMLQLLRSNLCFVSSSVDAAQPADVVAFCDELLRDKAAPRHVGFLTYWKREGVPYAIHSSERGVVEHRLDLPWKQRVHSVWRARELSGGQEIALDDEAARKLDELVRALEAGKVAGPLAALVPLILPSLIGIGVSYGLGLLVSALTPTPRQRVGQQTGELQITQSSFGGIATEIYGGDPGDGKYGCKTAGNIIWTGGIDADVIVSRQQVGGGKGGGGRTQEVEQTVYDLSLAILWGRGELEFLKEYANADVIYQKVTGSWTGILDSTVLPDDDYDQTSLPDPALAYDRPADRHNGLFVIDGVTGAHTGTTVAGGYAPVTFYPGVLLMV